MAPNKVLGELGGELYILKDKFSSKGIHQYLSLETYCLPDLMLTNSSDFKLPHIKGRGKAKLIDMYIAGENIILFFDHQKVKMAALNAKFQKIDYKCFGVVLNKKGKAIGEPILLHEELWEVKPYDDQNRLRCHVTFSNDSTTFLLYSGNIKNGKLVGKLLDQTLNTVSSYKLDLPFTKSFSLLNLMLDNNNGNTLYFISKENTSEPKKFAYKLFAFDLNNKTFKSKPLPIKTTFPLSAPYLNKYHDKLQVAAYFYEGMKTKTTGGGMAFYEFDASNLEIKREYESTFDATTVAQLNSNSKFVKTYVYDTNDNAINTLSNTKIVNLPNGESFVISEQLIRLDLASTYDEDYFNMIVSHISSTGISASPAVIPKLQSGKKKAYYSYIDVVKNNQLYLIYNDKPANLDCKDPYNITEGVSGVNGSIPVLVNVSSNGTWRKKAFYKVDDNTAYIYPSKYYHTKSDNIVIYGQFENKIRFATLKL